MKRIVLKTIEEQLDNIGADEIQKAFILNSVRVYNDTLKSYKDGNHKEKFFLMQINAQILNQIAEIKKNGGGEEKNPFTDMIEKIENLKNEE